MGIKQTLPIGMDDFRKIREGNYYYVDKTLLIKNFLELNDEVALIARPRRFGKTLNMTMLHEFFDIAFDSRDIFSHLQIMETEYAKQINSRPVIYFTFKNVKGKTVEELTYQLKRAICNEYERYIEQFENQQTGTFNRKIFYKNYNNLIDQETSYIYLSGTIADLIKVVYAIYHIRPILLIDEYDQPIISSYESGYHDQLGDFFSNLYGDAMKGNSALGQALLTGVQRVAKESIFSQFNNTEVYTVRNRPYSPYFGLTTEETEQLLTGYGWKLDETVQKQYNGYRFGNIQMYNPWSILKYAKSGVLDNYWVNTSSNFLVKQALEQADRAFWERFDRMVLGEAVPVSLTLDTSYIERGSNYSLWGLLVNAGYLTIQESIDVNTAIVKIPNSEVLSVFQSLIAEISGIETLELREMFQCLLAKDMGGFIANYRKLVVSSTSYMDAKENAYHMLFLGMCMTLRGAYEVTSNLETGYGRSDITLKSLRKAYHHVIIEFKQTEEENLIAKAQEALKQIKDKEYYATLDGEVICIGLAHDKKRCEMVYETLAVF